LYQYSGSNSNGHTIAKCDGEFTGYMYRPDGNVECKRCDHLQLEHRRKRFEHKCESKQYDDVYGYGYDRRLYKIRHCYGSGIRTANS